MQTLRVLSTAAILLSISAIAAEPSGGAGNANNTLTIGARRSAAHPWPEPDAAAVEKLTAELREQLPDESFTIARVGPWIVATDLTKDRVPRFMNDTIAKYAGDIQKQLFTKTPRSEPVKVMLFKDRLSYETWNKKLFGEKPSTPYGYYSRQRKALVMNIGTGGGTLLHEMVHAMAEADYPEIPAWLNEGLGSLFEASDRSNDNKVIGITNWRLEGLQRDLKQNTATKFSDLLGMSDNVFYGERSGANYAASRYLMQWLQEHGKLEAFYTRIRDKKDASPSDALRAVFGNKKTIDELQTECYAWVKTLSL